MKIRRNQQKRQVGPFHNNLKTQKPSKLKNSFFATVG